MFWLQIFIFLPLSWTEVSPGKQFKANSMSYFIKTFSLSDLTEEIILYTLTRTFLVKIQPLKL